MRIIRLPMRFGEGLRLLEQELDRVAEKHGIEEPLRLMPELEEDDEDETDV